jgi:hypothetical protein
MSHKTPASMPDGLSRPPNFSKLQARIDDAQRKRKALEDMLAVLNSTDNFDAADSRSVEELLYTVLQEEQGASGELARREKIYNETLRAAQQQLRERHDAMTQLNDRTEAFDLFPELAQKFAQKQANMTRLVEDATMQLEAL